jgi:hypothetical protein
MEFAWRSDSILCLCFYNAGLAGQSRSRSRYSTRGWLLCHYEFVRKYQLQGIKFARCLPIIYTDPSYLLAMSGKITLNRIMHSIVVAILSTLHDKQQRSRDDSSASCPIDNSTTALSSLLLDMFNLVSAPNGTPHFSLYATK